ncbi:hypothetical protein [Tenacibaculum sp. M341]|uniref:hypothetical protein n=1 Tax=Tenacibaculum sp. M341 TaxID=2530339 RepID=UPI00104980C9|nr:hypothetical protein [Tenacibaculum sp. M341]TCI94270.1 hypothetical protein EYW44_02685 [Tenacibaculum sp. M341]
MNSRVLTILIAVISVIGFILFGLIAAVDAEDAAALSAKVSPFITYSVVLLIASIAIAVVASLLGVLKNPEALKKTLLGLAALVVVLVISYLVADSKEVIDAEQEVIAAAGSSVSKLTSTGIWASLVLLVVGGAFFIFDLFKGLIK